jgi:hypothetical protein
MISFDIAATFTMSFPRHCENPYTFSKHACSRLPICAARAPKYDQPQVQLRRICKRSRDPQLSVGQFLNGLIAA